jgi:tetratricopeptide (TPR) repeat protein
MSGRSSSNNTIRSEAIMTRKSRFLLLLALAAAISGIPGHADVMNTVKGTILDRQTGQPIAGVRVTLVPTRSRTSRIELITDDAGAVFKNGIATGSYEVQFEREGYFPVRSSIRLTIGDSYDVSLKLEPVPARQAGGTAQLRAIVELANAGRFAEGARKAGEAIAQEPASALLHYYRGYCLERSGDAAAATIEYGRAVELKPDFALGMAGLGKLLARQGEYAKAAAHFRKSLELVPDDADALYNYGICLVNLGDNSGAGEAFARLLAADPGHADAWYQLGIVLLGQGNMPRARECLQKFLALEPQHRDAATARQILDSLK